MKRQIIDAHYHNCQWYSHGQTFLEFQQEYREKCGVTGFLLLCVPSIKGQATHFCPAQNILGAISKLEDKTNSTYVYGGLFYPDAPIIPEKTAEYNFKSQAETLMEIGFDGMKMFESKPTINKKLKYGVDREGYEEYFSYLEENEIPLLMHVNDPHNFWDPETAPPLARQNGWFYGDGTFATKEEIYAQVYNVLERHPKLKVTLPHGFFLCDGPEGLSQLFDTYENVYTDLAPGPVFLEAMSNDYENWKAFFNKYYKRILFATDAKNFSPFPLTDRLFNDVYRFIATDDVYSAFDYYDNECTLHGMGLDEEKLQAVLAGNYLDIVGHKAPKAINRKALGKYIEGFIPNLVDGETKDEIIKYYKENF